MAETVSLDGWTINKNGSFYHKGRKLKLVKVKDFYTGKYYYNLFKEGDSKNAELFSTPFEAIKRSNRSPKFKDNSDG